MHPHHHGNKRGALEPQPADLLPPPRPGRADFDLLTTSRYVLLVPASRRGAWFLTSSPLCDPPRLLPRIGTAHLLPAAIAAALLPALADHFRLRPCRRQPAPHASSPTH